MNAPTSYTTAPAECPRCGGKRQPHNEICARCMRRLATAAKAEAARIAAEPEPEPPWSPFRCRAHPDVVVDRRGKGCEQCQFDAHATKAQNARARAEARAEARARAEMAA